MYRASTTVLALLMFGSGVRADPAPQPSSPDAAPNGLLSCLGSSQFRHNGFILGAEFTPDRKRLITIDHNGHVYAWDAPSGRQRFRFDSALGSASRAATVSPDGRLLATAYFGTSPRVWSLATGKLLQTGNGKHQKRITRLRFSPDSKTIFSAALDGAFRVWDVQTGKMLREYVPRLPGQPIHADCSADGKLFLLVDDQRAAHFFDTGSGKALLTVKDCSLKPPLGIALAFSPDCRRVALVLGEPAGPKSKHVLRVCEPATGKVLCDRELVSWTGSLEFAPDGKSLLTVHSTPPAAFVWEVVGGKQRQRIELKETRPPPFAFSADGKHLLAFGASGLVRWDVATGKQLDPDPDPEPGKLLALSPDGKTLVTHRYPDLIRLFDAGSGKELARLKGYAAAAFSPDGKLLARAQKADKRWHRVRFYDMAAGKELTALDEALARHLMKVNAIAFTPDGKTLVTGCDDGKVRSFDTTTGRHLRVFQSATPHRIHSLSLSPDGRFLALALVDYQVRLYDLAQGKRLLTWSRNWRRRQVEARSVAFSPDSRLLLVAGGYPRLQLFELASGQEIPQLPGAPLGYPDLVAFSPASRVIAGALPESGLPKETESVHLCDILTGQTLEPLPCLGSQANVLCFSADGSTLAVGLKDGRILVWDLALRTRGLARPRATLDDAKALALWADLADRNAATAHRAVQSLIAAGNRAVSFLKSHLKPAAPIDPRRVRESLADLDSKKPGVRKKAFEFLEDVLDQALPLLREERARTTSAEVRKRLDELLGRPGLIKSASSLRNTRAIAILGQVGSAEARQLLRELARGSLAAPETHEAKRALVRLSGQAARQ